MTFHLVEYFSCVGRPGKNIEVGIGDDVTSRDCPSCVVHLFLACVYQNSTGCEKNNVFIICFGVSKTLERVGKSLCFDIRCVWVRELTVTLCKCEQNVLVPNRGIWPKRFRLRVQFTLRWYKLRSGLGVNLVVFFKVHRENYKVFTK